jgi:diguanylate cyclase (GGDEF)-like protein/PAS domain S-box-containing protein
MASKSLIFRHALLSAVFVAIYLLLSRPEVIFISGLGFTAWYPATGLILALMLGISPWYGILVCLSDALAGAAIYHQPLKSFGETVGAVGVTACYAAAAWILRTRLRIDPGLRRRQDVVRYILITIAAAFAATLVGVFSLVGDESIGWSQFWPSAASWFFGDGIGILGVAPFFLIHVLPRIRSWLSGTKLPRTEQSGTRTTDSDAGHVAEGIGQVATLVAILWVIFGPVFGERQLFYLSYVPIIWMAMRQGVRRVVIGLVALNFGIVVALHLFSPTPGALAKVGLLMLVVSGVGLIVGSEVTERHRIAMELEEQTIFLNSLIENNPMGIAVLDREGRVEVANAAFEKLFQYDRTELAGRDLDPLLSPPEEPLKSAQITRQVFAGEAVRATARRRRKDGRLLDVEVHGVPLSANGRVRRAFTIYKDISDEIRAAEKEKKNTASLAQLVEELRVRTIQMTWLNEMGDLLECCSTVKEACAVVSQYVQKLFPESVSGSLYLFKASRNAAEAAAHWGASGASQAVFPLEACWALRRGSPHWSVPAQPGISCPHLATLDTTECLCVPMIGQEDTLGVLYLEFNAREEVKANFNPENLQDSRQRLATTVAGQVAFSLTSLRLRETLRDQSIRDPLTGLFNRRFMEESLNRELLRAARKRHSVALLFLDLDNFKHFNDAFGHDAGDLVLRSIADLFRRFFRSDDVCCRYGGEEFALILPESTAEYAAVRANELRDEIKSLNLQYKDRTLGKVSVSIGVAAFPEHGSSSEELLGAADRCLYQSKGAGRDTVTVATPQLGQTPSGVLR